MKKLFTNYDILLIEIGADLVPAVDPDLGGSLLEKIGEMRTHFKNIYGMILPPIKISDNPKLKPKEYKVYLRNILISEHPINGLTEESIDDNCLNNIINHLYQIIERHKEVIKKISHGGPVLT